MHNIALIGAGRIGQIHAANAAAHPGLKLTAVVDPVGDAAAQLSARHGSKVIDIDELFADPQIDGVIIASSTDTHLDYAMRAARSAKAAFCEKPIDLDLARARTAQTELAKAALFLGFNRRFDPHFSTLKRKLDAGSVGMLETLHITSHDPAPPPPAYVAVSGGLFKDMAIHDFDMARWLLNDEIVQVFAAGAVLIDPEIGKLGDIDTAKTLLRTKSGKLCVISNSRRSGYGYDQRIEAFGAQGVLKVDNVRETECQVWNESGAHASPLQNFFLDRYAQAYQAEIAHFADILDNKSTPSVGYGDGVAALELAEAALTSLKSGKPIAVSVSP